MLEKDVIEQLIANLPGSSQNLSEAQLHDSQIIKVNGQNLAFSIDEFSQEDGFPSHTPFIAGWNSVMGCFSDVIATGAEPLFFLNSFQYSQTTSKEWVAEFSRGMGKALLELGAISLGGDISCGDTWKVVGMACGIVKNEHLRNRYSLATEGTIVVTGNYGAFSAVYLCPLVSPQVECRLKESRYLAGICFNSCAVIDTSDGLISALQTMSGVNPALRLEVDLSRVPISGLGDTVKSFLSHPQMLCFGSAGEYELLALIPSEHSSAVLKAGMFTQIGSFAQSSERGLFYRTSTASNPSRHKELPDPRAFASSDEYIAVLKEYLKELFR